MSEEKVEVPKKFEEIVKKIEEMSVLDLSELVKILEKKFNVSAAMPMMVASAGAASAGDAPASEEKAFYTVELNGIGEKKIEVIKVVRDITQKGLKEAKELVDSAATAPQLIAEDVKKEDAEEMKKKFEAVGAQVDLK
jgi:large subunit ribosomal protein L7/L12